MLGRLLSTLVKLQVFHTVTLSHMCDQKAESLSGLEEEETAGVTGFKLGYRVAEALLFSVAVKGFAQVILP